jgi:hypothetical protein
VFLRRPNKKEKTEHRPLSPTRDPTTEGPSPQKEGDGEADAVGGTTPTARAEEEVAPRKVATSREEGDAMVPYPSRAPSLATLAGVGTIEETPVVEVSATEGALTPEGLSMVEETVTVPPVAPVVMEVHTAGETPVVEEVVVEMSPPEAPLIASKGARISPQLHKEGMDPEGSTAPSPPRRPLRECPRRPSRAAWALALTSRAPLGGMDCADAIQVAHLCLDQLGENLEVVERRQCAEHAPREGT